MLTAVSLVGNQDHFLRSARVTPQLALGSVTSAVAAANWRRHLQKSLLFREKSVFVFLQPKIVDC
jgi:hypothetical protein